MPNNNKFDFIGFLGNDEEKKIINEDVLEKLQRYWVLAGLRQSKDNLKSNHKILGDTDAYNRQISYLRRQIFWHYVKNIFFFPIWLVRLLTPSFLKGTPNLWTNIKLLATKPEFHPLRMAMVAWIIFTYLVIQGGIYFFRTAPPAEAATFTWVQTAWTSSSTNNAVHDTDRTGWVDYFMADSEIVTSTELTLATTFSSYTEDDNGATEFGGGTHNNTQWDATNTWVELDATGLSTGSGDYTSIIFDSGTTSVWATTTWTPQRPYGKQISSNAGETETGYTEGNENTTNLIFLMHLNETGTDAQEGDTITESSPSSLNGTLYTGSDGLSKSSSSAVFGTSVQFDGTDDYIEVLDNAILDFTDDFTIGVWAKSDTATPHHSLILNKKATSYTQGDAFMFHGSEGSNIIDFKGTGSSGNYYERVSSFTADSGWHFYTARMTTGDLEIFVDGILRAPSFGYTGGALTANNDNFWIGRSDNLFNADTDGAMDEIVIFTRVLSDAEISDLYKRGALKLKFQVRSCDDSACSGESFVGPDGTTSDYYDDFDNTSYSAGPTFALTNVSNNRYFQYKAFFETVSSTLSPELNDVTIDYKKVSQSLVSSAFDSGNSENVISSLAWTESLPSGTDIKFQIRTAPDSAGSPGTWTDWLGPTDTTDFYTNSAGGETINSTHTDGLNDQWMQYKVFLSSSNSTTTPTLSDVTLTYVVNAAPQISGSGVTATQLANGDVSITWGAYDSDTGTATTSFEYSLNNGDTWSNITGYLSSGATSSARSISSWTTSTVTWTARDQIDGNYAAQAKIRVTENDGEGANNTTSSTSAAFALDVKDPVVASMVVIATTTPATVRLSVTDDSTLQMGLSLDSALAGVTWATYAANTTFTLGTDPDTLYAQFRDNLGNTTTIFSSTTPGTPGNMVIRDISNINTSDYKEFIAWSTVANPSVGFSGYEVWFSTDGGSTYSLLTTVADRATNYYVHTGLSSGQSYHYKISASDVHGNTSYFSSVVNDSADGQGGTDQTTPTISNIATSTVTTQGFTVTWGTDEISSSSVAVSATSFGGTFTTTTVNTMVDSSSGNLGQHSVTITGLSPNTSYYFQVASNDPSDNIIFDNNSGSGYNVQTLSGPSITGIAYNCTQNDQISVTWNTSVTASSSVYYSTASDLSNATQVTDTDLVTSHSVDITGLTQATTYYFYVESNNATDKNAGNYYSCTTASDTTAPTISSVTASPVADTTAVITWTTNENSTSHVLYGTTNPPSHGDGNYSTLSTNLNTNHSQTLTGLAVETTYYYFVASVDGSGNAATSTPVSSFTTLEVLSEESAVVAREVAAEASGASGAGGGGGFPYSPSDNIPPVISNIRVSEINADSAVVEWDTSESGDSFVEFGRETNYGNISGDFGRTGKHRVEIFNLLPGARYNFRVTSEDNAGNRSYSGNQVFTAGTGFESALPSFDESGGDSENVFTALISRTADIIKRMSTQVSVDTLESGLAAQYTTISELGKLVPLPLIGGQPVVEVGSSYARVFWTTDKASNSLVGIAPESIFQVNNEYAQIVGNATESVDNHEVLISELKPNTTYHYQVRSKTPVSDTAKSRDFTFTTKEEQLEVTTYRIDSQSPDRATFSWVTNVPTDSRVTYIPYNEDGQLMPDRELIKYDKNVTTIHEVDVDGLEGGLIYRLELSGKDASENIVSKTITSYSTSQTDVPPIITQVQTDAALLPGDESRVQAIISWITNEPSTSQIFYQKGFAGADGTTEFSQKTPIDPNYIRKHIMVLTNFEPGAVYQFQVESTDSTGNATRSRTFTILTPRQKESVFQVIMGNIEETFSWVGQLGI